MISILVHFFPKLKKVPKLIKRVFNWEKTTFIQNSLWEFKYANFLTIKILANQKPYTTIFYGFKQGKFNPTQNLNSIFTQLNFSLKLINKFKFSGNNLIFKTKHLQNW